MSNFKLSEFDSKDGANMPKRVEKEIKFLIEQLEVIRAYFKAPITINSGYRSPKHNAKVKGSKDSQHLLGRAADIVVKDVEPRMVEHIIRKLISEGKIAQGGVGLYKNFVHYDTRGIPARWIGNY
jgi:uncharacterized protein YcbK (DUF882 family)